jgi:hypothetical protein
MRECAGAQQQRVATGTGETMAEPLQAKFSRRFARQVASLAEPKGLRVFLYDESYTCVYPSVHTVAHLQGHPYDGI